MKVDTQYDFLKTLCDLFDGNHSVPYAQIKEKYPACPAPAILNKMIDKNYVLTSTARDSDNNEFVETYSPTPAAFQFLKARADLRKNTTVALVAVVIAALSLIISVVSLFIGRT